jgi:AcrR family transcriptional regulator
MDSDKLIEVYELFMQYGIKSLTMDDVARKLHISKKTLYTMVKDKNDLVSQCIHHFTDEATCFIQEKASPTENAIDQLTSITKHVLTRMNNFHPSVMYDLEKFHPESLAIIEDFKSNIIYNILLLNLEKGIEQGFYRENINKNLVLNLYFTVVDSIMLNQFKYKLNNEMSFKEAYLEFLEYHVRGIASEKGINHLSKTITHIN